MNSYVICPAAPIWAETISEYAGREQSGRGRKSVKGNAPGVITSRGAFDRESFKGLFKSPSATDTIFIVPELDWDNDPSSLQGYQVAQDLICGKLAGDSFVNIMFVSQMTRQQLLWQVEGTEYAGLVQSFPHVTIDDILDTKEAGIPVPVPLYSPIQFELLKRVVISKSGHLDLIRHKLAHLTRIDGDDPDKVKEGVLSARESIRKVLHLLALPSYGGENPAQADGIRRCREALRDASSKEDIRVLVQSLRQLIDDIKERGYTGAASSVGSSGEGLSVLIVEDDPVDRSRMKEFFKTHLGSGTKVTAYDNAVITGDPFPELPDVKVNDARSRIAEEAGKYNLVILDMMYTSDGNEDSPSALFNGFDLYQSLREAEMKGGRRKAAVRIITALPRNEVSRLAKKYIGGDPPVVFTKGNDWEQLKGCLLDRMDEIVKECRNNEDSFLKLIPFPKRGVFRRPGMYEAIVSHPEEFRRATQFARDIAGGTKKMSEENCSLTVSKNPEELIAHLPAILAHRRLVVKFLLSGRAPVFWDNSAEGGIPYFDEDRYREFLFDHLTESARSSKGDNNFDKNYLHTKLGFKVSQLPDENRGTRSGKLTRKQKQACFQGQIDLEDFFQFFTGELDSPGEEATPDALVRWIKYTAKILESKKNVSELHLAEPCRQSGVDAFLLGEKTPDSYRKMLEGVGHYLSSKEPRFIDKKDLQNVFITHLDLRAYPKSYEKIRGYSKDMVNLLDGIVDLEF